MLKHIPFYASLMGAKLYDKDTATTSHVLVYGAIEAHSIGDKGCIASNKTIASETGLKESTTAKCISQLNKAGWVSVELDDNNHRKLIQPLLTIAPPLPTSKPPFTPQKTPLYSTVNIDNSNKNTVIDNSTNVELAKPVIKPTDTIVEASDGTRVMINGRQNPDIEASFIHWQQIVGYPISSNITKNRFAASNLVKKHGLEGVKGLIRGVAKSQQDQYAPRISDFVELQAKLSQLLAWGRRSTTNSGGIRIIGVKK